MLAVDVESRFQEMVDKLHERGCRLTPQRMAVLEVLASGDDHPSVEQIYERVRTRFPTTSLATIYKTVALLKDLGQVVELGFGAGRSRYDGGRPYPHPHLICLRCQKIQDLELDDLDDLPQTVGRRTGYRIVRQQLDFFGICPQCQGAEI